jgi:CubicO group peptidase (beta-lactamase class C family)
VAILGLGASACCHPPGFIPRVPSECINWDYKQSRHEIRGFANDLANLLPDWPSTMGNWQKPGSVRPDYGGLKAAAIKLARAPQCVHRAVIESYNRAYGGGLAYIEYDEAKTSGLFVLMRVLFRLPTHYTGSDVRAYGWWYRPSRKVGAEKGFDMSWPVHEDPSGRVLEINWYRGAGMAGGGLNYDAVREYAYLAERFPMRTVAEIQALEIRPRP